MVEKAVNRLTHIVETVPGILMELGEETMSFKPSPARWSKKQILGHLIDSATNNHQRFIRGQFENLPEIRYDQDKWNEYGFYQQMDVNQIISFWTVYNKQLIELMKQIPEENLKRAIRVGENTFTLEFLMVDYVDHLEHHLKQVVEL